jgi:hypothetical protein
MKRPAGHKPSVLFLCDSDSQIFGSVGLARAFAARGWAVGYILFSDTIPETARAIVAAAFEVRDIPWEEVLSKDLVGGCDAIGFYSFGSRINAFRHWFADAFPGPTDSRPVLFTGFNGLILEKFEEGVSWRVGCDLVTVGGEVDAETYRRSFAGTGVEDQPIVVCGLGFANVVKRDTAPRARKRLVFAEQAVIPRARADRLWLFGQLARIADASPGWDVVIKVRVSRGETTFHAVKDHAEDLLRYMEPVPSNLIVSAGSLAADLKTADLMMTVSSTAVFEALRSDIPVATVGDLGISNQFGTHVFANSGLSVALNAIESLDDFVPPVPDPAWLARTGVASGRPEALVERVEALRREGRPLPRPFYGPDGVAPLPARFEFREAVDGARSALLAGDPETARSRVRMAKRLRPDDFVARVIESHLDRGLPGWLLGPRILAGRVAIWTRHLGTRFVRRPLRRRPPAGPLAKG